MSGTAEALVRTLEQRGVKFTVEDGLVIDAPTGVITDNWRCSLRQCKDEITELIGRRHWKSWWNDQLTVADNVALDEFMQYGPGGEGDTPDWD
jgi:hypothetical protein